MSIVHITNPADLKAVDKAIFAPFGVPNLFSDATVELDEHEGQVGYFYDDPAEFYRVVTPEGNIVDTLTLVDATRDVFTIEAPENVGKEVLTAADLTNVYGVRVILRHNKYGDYRGFASNDDIDGREWVRLLDGVGHGSFGFWRSGGYTIYLAVGLDYKYEF